MMNFSTYLEWKPVDSGSMTEIEYNRISGSFEPWLRQYLGYGSESTSSLSVGMYYGMAEGIHHIYSTFSTSSQVENKTNISSETIGDHSISYVVPQNISIETAMFPMNVIGYFQPFKKARFL